MRPYEEASNWRPGVPKGHSGLCWSLRNPVLANLSFTDASFAPNGSRSQQAAQIYLNGALIAWTSSRQAFVTMSTAESELVCICEGVTALKSLEGLVATSRRSPTPMAACQTSAGSWRTRHLRIRGSTLRELLDGPDWMSYHLDGHLMLADLGTKGVPSDRFWHLMQLMGLHRPVDVPAPRGSPEKVKQMIAMMMIVALLPEAEASSTQVVLTGQVAVPGSSTPSYLLFMAIVIGIVIVWELMKGMIGRYCCCCFAKKEKAAESDSDSGSSTPRPRTSLPRPRQRKVRPAVKDKKGSVLCKVYMTPNGTCAHASKECSTLNVSQEFVERRLCTVCCKIKRFSPWIALSRATESGRGSACVLQ